MSASFGSRVGNFNGGSDRLTGPIGNRVGRGLPESSIIAQLGSSLREIRDTMDGHEGSGGGHRPRILVGMGPRRKGGTCPKAPRSRHAGCA